MESLSYHLTDQFIFAVQLLVAGSIYSIYLTRRRHFPMRALACTAAYLLTTWLLSRIPLLETFFLAPIIVFLLFAAQMAALYELDFKKLCFVSLASFATQHTAVALADALRTALSVTSSTMWWDILCWLSFAAVLSAYYFLFGNLMRYITTVKMQSSKLIFTSFLVFMVVYLLRVLGITQMERLTLGDEGQLLQMTLHLYSAVGSSGALMILFTANHEDELMGENRVIEQLLYEREVQQRFYNETIELVNLKCHDMKHQIALLRQQPSGTDSEATLCELEKTAALYDSFAHTRNGTLDTILTEKGLYCEGHNISLNCMADGACLYFLSSADLCSLFGNILENAIEAVQKEEPESRMISLQVFRKMDYACIHAENYCSTPPELQDGLPQTRKTDKRCHGFGMKSIRYIAEKYGGNMTISIVNRMFCVDIMFPLPETEQGC